MEQGTKQLDEAADQQNASRRWVCIMLTIVQLVVLYKEVWHKK
jgi:hypothetical protein